MYSSKRYFTELVIFALIGTLLLPSVSFAAISVGTPQLNATAVNPGGSFAVTANISDESNTSIKSANITCVGSGGVEGVDGWDSYTLQNGSLAWNALDLTTMEVSGAVTLNTSSINGTWTCTDYGYNATDDSASASNNSLGISTRVGIILSQSTCTYSSGNPGSTNNAWTCGGSAYDRITQDGNIGTTITVNGTDLTGQTDASWLIAAGNVSYTNVTAGSAAPSPPGILRLSLAVANTVVSWSRGTYPSKGALDLYAWLDYPSPLKAQTYQGTMTLLASGG